MFSSGSFRALGRLTPYLSVDQKVIDREGKEGGRVSVEKEGEGNWLVVSQEAQPTLHKVIGIGLVTTIICSVPSGTRGW